jgi:hypothetical protein
MKRFTTDKRLWLFISLALFLVPWFVLRVGKWDDMCPAGLWIILFQYPDHFFETAYFLLAWTLILGIPAVSVGWVLQCLAVMIKGALKGGAHDD